MSRFTTLVACSLVALAVACGSTACSADAASSGPVVAEPIVPGAGEGVGDAGNGPDTGRPGDGGRNDPSLSDAPAPAACATGTADCDGNGSCETDIATSVDHCGSCGAKCGATSVCVKAACAAPADHDAVTHFDSRMLVSDALKTYWITYSQADDAYAVHALSHDGSAVLTLATNIPKPTTFNDAALAVSDTDLFLAVYGATGVTVHRAPKTGGAFTAIVQATQPQLGGNQRGSFVVSSGYAFWTGGEGVYRAPVTGGTSQLWTKTGCAEHLTAASGMIYWSCLDGKIAYRSATSAPDLALAFPRYVGSEAYAVGATELYDLSFSGIQAQSLAVTSNVPQLRVSTTSLVSLIETDGAKLYWSASQTGAEQPVFVAPNVAGATPSVLSSAHEPWKDIAVGGSWLYVATYGGYVYRVAKP